MFQQRPERFRLFYLGNTKETLCAAVWERAQNHLLKVLHSHSVTPVNTFLRHIDFDGNIMTT